MAVLGLFLLVELGARFGLARLSAIERRTETEQKAAFALGGGALAHNTVLLAGNSLPLEDIDLSSLKNALSADFRTTRYVVEQTYYLDWYYGLRSLYAAGSRPGVVALSLNAGQFTGNQIRGDYFAYRMMMTRDFLAAGRDAGLSATATSSLLLASLSAFYGTRSETRTVLLARLLPGMRDLVPYMTPIRGKQTPDRGWIIDAASQRLRTMDAMARAHGARFLLIVPADMDKTGPACLVEAGARAGVTVLVPLAPESLSPQDFRDGFHLNPTGAARYTKSLGPMLKQAVSSVLR
ncbi:MAG: hypothetical protein WBY44_15130 [Bryobacteraceae bacterium]|jgi:hypothetical protein